MNFEGRGVCITCTQTKSEEKWAVGSRAVGGEQRANVREGMLSAEGDCEGVRRKGNGKPESGRFLWLEVNAISPLKTGNIPSPTFGCRRDGPVSTGRCCVAGPKFRLASEAHG